MSKLEKYLQAFSDKDFFWVDHEESPEELLHRLKLLKEDVEVGIYPLSGICHAVKLDTLNPEQLFEGWVHYSGDPSFPVPHPSRGAQGAYEFESGKRWVGKYGTMRKSLLDHVINLLEEHCNA